MSDCFLCEGKNPDCPICRNYQKLKCYSCNMDIARTQLYCHICKNHYCLSCFENKDKCNSGGNRIYGYKVSVLEGGRLAQKSVDMRMARYETKITLN